MKTAKKGLQRLTNSQLKIEKVFNLKQITENDLSILTKAEETQLFEKITTALNEAKGVERDNIIEKIDLIAGKEYRSQIWEYNHSTITSAIATLMQELGRMPAQREIATKSGLSRQTISKHINEYTKHNLYLSEVENFRFMASKVLAKMFQFAVNGDTGAAKIFLKAVGAMNETGTNSTLIKTQNNFVQINGMVIKQETLMQLSPEQIYVIESVFKAIPTETIKRNT